MNEIKDSTSSTAAQMESAWAKIGMDVGQPNLIVSTNMDFLEEYYSYLVDLINPKI